MSAYLGSETRRNPQDAPEWSTDAPYPILDCNKGGGPTLIHEELLLNDKSLRGLTHRLLLPLWSYYRARRRSCGYK